MDNETYSDLPEACLTVVLTPGVEDFVAYRMGKKVVHASSLEPCAGGKDHALAPCTPITSFLTILCDCSSVMHVASALAGKAVPRLQTAAPSRNQWFIWSTIEGRPCPIIRNKTYHTVVDRTPCWSGRLILA